MLERGKLDRGIMEMVDLEGLVPSEHLLRKIDVAVDFHELYEIVEALYSEDQGRPSVDPVVLFKMVLIEHLYGLGSLRRTAEEVSPNVAYRWFLGYPLQEETPHFSIIVDLQDIQHRNRYELLTALRQARFVPIMALMDSGGAEEAARILDFGVDICMPANIDPLLIRKHAKALIRRYTSYNHYDQPESIDIAPFQCGDIYIDSMRRTVQVCNEPVELRPREFSLLLYFMRNPRIVLTSEQICDRAWGNEGSYGQGISGPVALLRRAIEPDPEHPIYIETIWRVGYRFTAHKSETCDKCHNRDGVM